MAAEYTVVVQGENFQLSRAQLEFDSPNLLTEYLLDNQPEANNRPIQFSTNRHLFSLIVEYLCGYTILPIYDTALPTRMSPQNALNNLRADAKYYKLEGLVQLIDTHGKLETADPPPDQKIVPLGLRASPLFHFPGRVANWSNMDPRAHHPSGYMEFPLSIDLSKSFSVACWYKAASNKGWHTLISIDVPPAPHPLLYVSISPDGDFRFEMGIRGSPDRLLSGPSNGEVRLNIWTHLVFTQHIDDAGHVDRRTLYIDGKELVSSKAHTHIYNPEPTQTRMAILRGSWDRRRTAGFLGQAEDISVFQRTLDQGEITTRASRVNAPADHGWQTLTDDDPRRLY